MNFPERQLHRTRQALPELADFVNGLAQPAQATETLPDLAELEATARQIFAGEDLVERFVAAAIRAGAAAQAVPIEKALDRLADWINESCNPTAAVLVRVESLPEPVREMVGLLAARIVPRPVLTRPADDLELFAAAAAVTGARCAVAETGSLVVESTPALSRGETLVTPLHIAVITRDQILPDLVDLLANPVWRQDSSNMTVITGPSKTADIEGVLVTGVHGPGDVRILVL